MNKVFSAITVIALLSICVCTEAAITIETVAVGDKGNAADSTGYGSVAYDYNIGKYEITAGQYASFLNAVAATDTYGLYNEAMWSNMYGCKIQRSGASGNYIYTVSAAMANKPVNYVSFWDSCRFVNWLNNGQGIGSTETGAYTLTSTGMTNNNIARNDGAKWVLANENEWYKAAYYDAEKAGGAGYWLYATRSNTTPANKLLATDSGNAANYYNNSYSIDSTTIVGDFEHSASAYGTFDQAGNVWERNETVVSTIYRGLRGGSFVSNATNLQASLRNYNAPLYEDYHIGFRVAEFVDVSNVPEPSSLIGVLSALLPIGIMLRRRKS